MITLTTSKEVRPQDLAHLVGQWVKVTFMPRTTGTLVLHTTGTVLFADAVVLDLKKAAGDTQTVLAEQIIQVEVLA